MDQYQEVQQDILQTFVDPAQLRPLTQPTLLPNGKRILGLKLDHPRQLAVMHALLRFSHSAAGNTFTTAELHPQTAPALGCSPADYRLSALRYDRSKLRVKGLVETIPLSRRYHFSPNGYRLCLIFLKLFENVYAHSPRDSSGPFPPTTNCSSNLFPHSTGSTRTSPPRLINSSTPLPSKPLINNAMRTKSPFPYA